MDQLLLRAEEVAEALNIGRSKAYEMMATGQLPVVHIGKSVRATAEGLRDYVASKAESISKSDPE